MCDEVLNVGKTINIHSCIRNLVYVMIAYYFNIRTNQSSQHIQYKLDQL